MSASDDRSQKKWRVILSSGEPTEVFFEQRQVRISRGLALILAPNVETAITSGLFSFELPVDLATLPQDHAIVPLTPLGAALCDEVMRQGRLNDRNTKDFHLGRLLAIELVEQKSTALVLPMPRDERALRLFRFLHSDNGFNLNLNELAKVAGASPRTIERIFRMELNMSFARWRQLVRIQRAITLLSEGQSVTDTALEVGYGSANAFIDAFRRHMGSSPNKFRSRKPVGSKK